MALLAVAAGRIAAGAAPPPLVEVLAAGRDADVARVQVAVAALGRGGARLRWTRLPAFDPGQILDPQAAAVPAGEVPVARVWIDVADRRVARLYLADRGAQRFLVRDLPLPDGLGELGQESLAQVVESSVAALLEDASVGLTRAEAASVLTARRAPAAAPVAFSVEALAGAQAAAPELPLALAASVRAAAGRRLDARWDAGLWLMAGASLPQDYAGPVIGARLQAFAARAGAGVTRALGARAALLGAVGVGPDLTRLEPQQGTTAGGSATLTDARWLFALVGRAELGVGFAAGAHAWWSVAAFAEADARPRHYDVALPEAPETPVIRPYRVRPGLQLGVKWR